MTNKSDRSISEIVNDLYDLLEKSESFRSLVAMGAWAITFLTTIAVTKEINYGILFSTIPLVSIMLIGKDDDDDDE